MFATWDEAMAYAEEFSEKAGTTWRLPTKKEMKSIMESSAMPQRLTTNVFSCHRSSNFGPPVADCIKINLDVPLTPIMAVSPVAKFGPSTTLYAGAD